MNELATTLPAQLPTTIEGLNQFIIIGKAELAAKIIKCRSLGLLKPNPKYVYFVQAENGGFVKIGKATNIFSRMQSLQNGSPVKLVLRKIIEDENAGELELLLHDIFKEYRIRGEWFEPQVIELYEAMTNE